jgi:hypothetical protein
MVSLEEQSKICNLITSCNDMIDGKFILADYKISNILKNITDSKEVYNLISNCMGNFSFEREFSKAQLRSSGSKKFSLPKEAEKILPFVFCVLVSIKNKNVDFDAFLKEFYKSEKGRADEYIKFATDIILPFRDIIADYFDIDITKTDVLKNLADKAKNSISNEGIESEQAQKTKLQAQIELQMPQKQIQTKTQAGERAHAQKVLQIQKQKIDDSETKSDLKQNQQLKFEDEYLQEKGEENLKENEILNLKEKTKNITVEKNEILKSKEIVEDLYKEIQEICTGIISELNLDRRINKNLKDDIIYITQTISYNCEKKDLKNIAALITAYSYVVAPVKSIRFLTKELKKVLSSFYN